MFMADIAGVRVLYIGDYSHEEDCHLCTAEIPQFSLYFNSEKMAKTIGFSLMVHLSCRHINLRIICSIIVANPRLYMFYHYYSPSESVFYFFFFISGISSEVPQIYDLCPCQRDDS